MSVEPPIVMASKSPNGQSRIQSTRDQARWLVSMYPGASPGLAVYIDLRNVEAVTPPFVRELLKAWPKAVPIGANEDVAATWDFVLAAVANTVAVSPPSTETEDS